MEVLNAREGRERSRYLAEARHVSKFKGGGPAGSGVSTQPFSGHKSVVVPVFPRCSGSRYSSGARQSR